MYDSTHIISSRDSTGYAEFPMPCAYPDFPSREQMLAYLRSYAEAFSVRELISFGTEVTRVVPVTPDGIGGWDVTMRSSDGTEQTRRYAGVAVCNGHHWEHSIPTRPGTFSGHQLQSKDYRNPDDIQGSRVLVVGAGNSGCDIAVEASRHFGHALISMRRGYHFLPKTVLGIPAAELDRPWLPTWAQRAFMLSMVRVIHGSNGRYGIPAPDHRLFDRHPVVNSEMLHALRHGRVEYRPDIERFDGKTVSFVDGRRDEVDTIVWATGFAVSFGHGRSADRRSTGAGGMSLSLIGRRVVVTGANGSLGSATAAARRDRGARVIGLDLVASDQVIACDVRDQEDVTVALARARDLLDGIERTPIHDASIAAGLSLESTTRPQRTHDVVATVVRALTATRAPRDVACTALGSFELAAASHVPVVADAVVRGRLRREVSRGDFRSAPLAAAMRGRLGL